MKHFFYAAIALLAVIGTGKAADEQPLPSTSNLETFYQEIDGRPILTIMFTHGGDVPLSVLKPFATLYVRINLLDSDGEDLMKRTEGGAFPERSAVRLVHLEPREGIHSKIDLLDGITYAGFAGHGTMPDGRHIPAVYANKYSLSPEDVANIRKIRVTLRSSWEPRETMFNLDNGMSVAYGINTRENNLFVGHRQGQVIEIRLDEGVNRTIPQFSRLLEIAEPVEEPRPQVIPPTRLPDGQIVPTHMPHLMPPQW